MRHYSYDMDQEEAYDAGDNGVMVESDGCMWVRDDFPLYGPAANELSMSDREFIDYFVPIRGIVTDGLTYYVYCRSIASWSQMESDSASSELLTVGNINAPVNSEKALSKIYPLLKRIAFPLSRLARSVCVGTWRLRFRVEYDQEGPTVHYAPHEEVIENPRGPEYSRMYMFVKSPITISYPYASPLRVPVRCDDPIINAILKPLRDDQKLDFLYRMYRVITDPTVDPSVIVFYGPTGHEGKTTLAKNLTRLLGGAVMWSTNDLVGSKSVWPSEDVVMTLCEKRILICDECEIENGFSYQHIKRWTSDAPVSFKTRTGFLSQTLIVVSNKIPFYEKAAVNNSIGRRLVIYDMRKDLGSSTPVDRSDITNSVVFRFMSLCLACGNAFSSSPTSPAIAMYTMFRKSINTITAGIGYDVTSTRDESVTATSMIAVRCRVKHEVLCNAMKAISSDMVMTPTRGIPYIKHIRPSDVIRLTAKGRDVVMATKGKATYDLDKLKEVVRLL